METTNTAENKEVTGKRIGIFLKYKDLGAFEFNQIISKIVNTPMKAAQAAQVRIIAKAVQTARDAMSEEYKTSVLANYFQKNEDGTMKTVEGSEEYIPVEGKENEIAEANVKFGEKEIEIMLERGVGITPVILSDVKVSARELELLKDLYVEQNGPGLPSNAIPFPQKSEAPQPRIQ